MIVRATTHRRALAEEAERTAAVALAFALHQIEREAAHAREVARLRGRIVGLTNEAAAARGALVAANHNLGLPANGQTSQP